MLHIFPVVGYFSPVHYNPSSIHSSYDLLFENRIWRLSTEIWSYLRQTLTGNLSRKLHRAWNLSPCLLLPIVVFNTRGKHGQLYLTYI